jgi:hypothetical protein
MAGSRRAGRAGRDSHAGRVNLRETAFDCRNAFFSALAEMGLPVICVETRHMRAVLNRGVEFTNGERPDVRMSGAARDGAISRRCEVHSSASITVGIPRILISACL